MALVTVQRSPSPSNAAESEDVDTEDGSNLKSPNRSRRRSRSALKRLKKLFHTVRFISKLRPCFSESYFTVKGAALILPQNDVESTYTKKICKNSYGDIQRHLESMIALLRRQDTIAVAVKLEMNAKGRHKYMAVVSCMGKQDTEESVILGIDFDETNQASIGLVLPIWADTEIALDGDGGFSIKAGGNRHMFKPVTVQVMWFTLQSLDKLVKIARENRYIYNGLSHTWVTYYETSITSDIPRINEWHTTEDLMFFKVEPVIVAEDDEEKAFLKRISVELKNVMMKEDLDDATAKYLRCKLEEQMNMNLDKWKSYIDQQMLLILGQMDSPTEIKDYLYLGSEWNASNIEELTKNGVSYIMNISREIDNFFPGVLKYYNIKEWDCEETNLLPYWEHTHKFISKVREKKSKILVHCKMGISRSACTVIAYLMKEYNMSRQEAYDYVKSKRNCIMPNKSFWHQLEIYEGILSASNQRHIFKQRSELNMSEKIKESDKESESMATSSFLEMTPELWAKDFDSYNDVFLKDSTDTCSNDFDEIASSSRSADSNEEIYPDLPSPKPEGATGGLDIEIDDDSETSDESEGEADDNEYITLPSITKSSTERGTKSTLEEKTSTAKMAECDLDIEKIESDIELPSISITSPADYGVHQHYLKENIPWSAGTVKKTKLDIEGKSKDDQCSLIKDGSLNSKLEDTQRSKVEDDNVCNNSMPRADSSSKYDELDTGNGNEVMVEQNWVHTIDGATVTETVVDTLDNNTLQGSEEKKEPNQRPTSVYEIEDIHLPPGIVRRTTQEIEEKNRLTDGTDGASSHTALCRSSSLKTDRDTPRKSKRNSERRKTITPILSPSSSVSCDASPSKDVSSLEFPANDSVFQNADNLEKGDNLTSHGDKRDSERVEREPETPDTDVNMDEADKAVYKFLGEEVSLEKGIVKKQTMGIELMNRERLSSEHEHGTRSHRNSESSTSNPVTPTENKVFRKDDNLLTTSAPQMEKSTCATKGENPQTPSSPKMEKSTLEKTESNVLKDPECDKCLGESDCIEEHIPEFSKAKENFEKAIAKTKEEEPISSTPKLKRRPEPRFDAATLELIREIGSAILNSPAKSEVEDFTEEEAQLGSGLVRHFVKNIERKTKQVNKKKEIIIIDKETQERKKSWRWSSPSEQKKASSPEPPAKKSLTHSLSSPGFTTPSGKKDISPLNKSSDSSPSPIRGSPTLKESPVSKSPPKISKEFTGHLKMKHPSDLDEGNENTGEKNAGVKKLLGIYQQGGNQGNQGLPGSHSNCSLSCQGNTTHLPGIKEDNSSESLKNSLENLKAEKDIENKNSDDEDKNEDCAILRTVKNQLKRTSDYKLRPKSVEIVRRNSAAPGLNMFTPNQEESSSGFSLEGRRVRRLQGRSHPLTKLEYRRKFYSTM